MNPTRITWSRLPWWVVDLGPMVVLALAAFVFGAYDQPEAFVTLIFVIAPLAFRRWQPLGVLLVVAAGVVTTRGSIAWVDIASVALASFTLGDLATDRVRSILAVFAIAAGMAVGFLLQTSDPLRAIALPFVILVPCWVVGDAVREWRVRLAAQQVEAERREREAAERLRASMAEERRRVARELHDVVAHGVSVMVVQAGAARQVLDSSPATAREAILAVETTGREAMSELRSLLDVLSSDGGDDGAGLEPQPRIAQLPTLIDRVKQAGLPARLEVEGDVRAIPSAAEVAVYRIVQEALTNALRHARASTVVRLVWEPQQLRVEVLDDGPMAEAAAPGSHVMPGHGVAGMQERATLAGGRLEAGPRLGGGYAVRLWLPIEPVTT